MQQALILHASQPRVSLMIAFYCYHLCQMVFRARGKPPNTSGPGLPGKMPGNTQTVIKRLNPYVDVTLGQMRLCHLPRQ